MSRHFTPLQSLRVWYVLFGYRNLDVNGNSPVLPRAIKDHNVDSIMPYQVTTSQIYVRMPGQNGNQFCDHFVLKESSTSCLWEWFFIVEYGSQLFRFYCSQGD